MTGDKKMGLFRTIQGTKVTFYRVRADSEGNMIIVEIQHSNNQPHEVEETKQPLTDEMWSRLQIWG